MGLGNCFLSPPPGSYLCSIISGRRDGDHHCIQPTVDSSWALSEFGSSECATMAARESDPQIWLLPVQSSKERSQKAVGNQLHCSNGFSNQGTGKKKEGLCRLGYYSFAATTQGTALSPVGLTQTQSLIHLGITAPLSFTIPCSWMLDFSWHRSHFPRCQTLLTPAAMRPQQKHQTKASSLDREWG